MVDRAFCIYSGREFNQFADEDRGAFLLIEPREFETLSLLYKTNPVIQAAANALLNHIFGGQMTFTKSDGSTLNAITSESLGGSFLLFAREMWASLWTYGFVMITISKHNIPQVLWPSQTSQVSVYRGQHGRAYYVRRLRDSDESPIHIWELSPPEIVTNEHEGGQVIYLNSIIKPLIRIDQIVSSKLAHSMEATSRLSRPTLYTAPTQQDVTAATIHNDFGTEGDSKAKSAEEETEETEAFHRNVVETVEFNLQLNRALEPDSNDYDRSARDPTTGGLKYPFAAGAKGYATPVVSLPNGRTAVPGPLASEPQDVKFFLTQEQQEVYQAFGLPHDLVGGTGTAYKAVNIGLIGEQAVTLNNVRTRSTTVVQWLFDIIYGGLDPNEHWDVNRHNVSGDPDKKDELQLLKAKIKHKVVVSFPARPDPTALLTLFETHAVDAKVFCQQMSFTTGLPMGMFDHRQLQLAQDYKLAALKLAGTPPPVPVAAAPTARPQVGSAGSSSSSSSSSKRKKKNEKKKEKKTSSSDETKKRPDVVESRKKSQEAEAKSKPAAASGAKTDEKKAAAPKPKTDGAKDKPKSKSRPQVKNRDSDSSGSESESDSDSDHHSDSDGDGKAKKKKKPKTQDTRAPAKSNS